ncbi:MAG: hypothetical protein HQ501_10430 [Rhodospirillales bacterium]|nr:hypothetical protein [Rhodospirillales bacterium]
MKKIMLLVVVTLFVFGVQAPASADGHETKIQKYVESTIRSWLGSKEILSAVHQQNLNHMGLTDKDIGVLDLRWRAEKLIGGGDLISSKMKNELSAFLRGIKAASGGVITEIFIMDNKGLNVAQTNGTGDYMQGDEAKWKKTFLVKAGSVFIDAVEEEDGINISQTSLTVARSNGYKLGAVTIGINVDALK